MQARTIKPVARTSSSLSGAAAWRPRGKLDRDKNGIPCQNLRRGEIS
ncbi:MAG: excalibur calcium-binding domain-containing protein [Mesorhizobium sp.]|nr:MAG: excalibur calcium-binding domain-containing protein [Mesorhizobium sp.]